VLWCSVFDFAIIFLFILGGDALSFILLIFVVLAFTGFFASKLLSRPLAITYAIGLSILIIVRIIVMILFPSIVMIIIQVIVILIDILILRFVGKYIQVLGKFDREKLVKLRPFVRVC
jgi:hypothetical protein